VPRVTRVGSARKSGPNWLIYLLNIYLCRIDTHPMTPTEWLARVRHDLVKRLVWPARDRRDMGGAPKPGELAPDLIDEEGQPIGADALWTALASEAPPGSDLTAFGAAVGRATAAAHAGDVDGVIALEAAYADLARSLNRKL